MRREIYQYTFDEAVPFNEIEESMFLATMAVESLHGRSSLRLDSAFTMDSHKQPVAVDASTTVGRDIARVFTGYLTRQFGEELFSKRSVNHTQA